FMPILLHILSDFPLPLADIGGIAAAGHLGGLLLGGGDAVSDAQLRRLDLSFCIQIGPGRAVPATPEVAPRHRRVIKKARGVDPPSGYRFRKPSFIDRLAKTVRKPAALHVADAPKFVQRAPAGAVVVGKALEQQDRK